jgi:hypothetical protein
MIFENIDDRANREVEDDRALGLRLLRTPIIDPDDPRAWWTSLSRAQQLPENNIVADPDTQSPQKPFSLRAASVVRQMAQELRLSRRPARIRGRHRRPAIGELAAAAIRVQTSPSINPELDPNRLALSKKILNPPSPPTMSLP